MGENEFSDLIGAIYDASLNPDLWDEVLPRTAHYLNTATATLGSYDFLQRRVSLSKSWGYDPAYLALLMTRYIKQNPMEFAASLTKTGDVYSIGDLMPNNEFFACEMYTQWGKPQGYIDAIQATLERTPTAYAALHCIRHEANGMVDDQLRQRVGLLWPHFRRAVLIGKVIDLHKVEAAALADTLDGLSAAMFLVDSDSRIVHANTPGRAMLQERQVVRSDDGRFCAVDSAANQSLNEIIGIAEKGDDAVGTRGITVSLSVVNGDRHVAHVLPLTSGARKIAGTAYSSVAALFVRKAALDGPTPTEAMVNAFKLTPAELRILLAVVQIGGAPEVASVLGISEATVKTHLQHVFEKTGTARQADLVKIVASFMGPLA
ncbi:MAG: helix-turn-helix transcriptional regulator [Candidatus Sulfotelmatobacter sp.]